MNLHKHARLTPRAAGVRTYREHLLAAWEEGVERSLLDPARPVRVGMAANGAARTDGRT